MKISTKVILISGILNALSIGGVMFAAFNSPAILFAVVQIMLIESAILLQIMQSYIFHPVSELLLIVREHTSHHQHEKGHTAPKDEIQQLQTAINDMIAEMTAKQQSLEDQLQSKSLMLSKNMEDFDRFNKTMVNRELTMIQMKKEMSQLRAKLGIPEEKNTVQSNEYMLENKFRSLDDFRKVLLNIVDDLQFNTHILQQERIKDVAVLQSIGDGVITTDQNGIVSLLNEQAEQMLGRSSAELVSKHIEAVLPMQYASGKGVPKNDIPIYVALTSQQKVSSSVTNPIYFVRKDESKFVVALTVTPVIIHDPLLEANTKLVGTVTIFRDITKEREIDRMKTEFISLASHQLRTPLSAIKWFIEMLLDGDAGDLTQEQYELIDNVHKSNERMIALVTSMLNISRIESGRIIIDPKPTNLKELLEEVISDVRVRLDEKKQNLVMSVREDLPLVSIDPKLIRQVYMNLLTNAIKYTPEQGEITIFLSRKDDEIISQVTDSGYGIPRKDYVKVFQKFYRGENVVKEVTDGNGLGLYLVKAIIESSKGKIWFESEEGKGTTFWFTLPILGSPAKTGEVTLDT